MRTNIILKSVSGLFAIFPTWQREYAEGYCEGYSINGFRPFKLESISKFEEASLLEAREFRNILETLPELNDCRVVVVHTHSGTTQGVKVYDNKEIAMEAIKECVKIGLGFKDKDMFYLGKKTGMLCGDHKFELWAQSDSSLI